MNNVNIYIADWFNDRERVELRKIRERVFVKEQNVPIELEWDEFDEVAVHILASDDNDETVGVARMFAHNDKLTIGRMAVLATKRNQGIGSALLAALLDEALNNYDYAIELSAQTHAIGFYEKLGFTVFGDEFQDARIPHYHMRYTPAG